ncbi:tetratricopeptide repeat-containing sensor histidine kinase [Chitinophaga costaii]|nr:tetratricopeptide repeat protein [Chitinophaga costaii]
MSAKFLLWFGLLFLVSLTVIAQDEATVMHSIDSVHKMAADTNRVRALLSLGRKWAAYFDNKKTDNICWQEAIALSQQLRYNRGLADAYNEIGTDKRNRSQYILAADYHEKAMKYAEETHDDHLIASSLNSIGVDYRRLDNLEKAFDFHYRALQVAEKINDTRNICVATNSIGNIELTDGKNEDAIAQFNRSLHLEEAANNPLGIAINLGNLGYAYQALKKTDLAIDYFKRSLAVNQGMKNNIGIAICYNALGSAYQDKKDYATAMDYLQKALTVNDHVDDKIHIAESYLSIGKLLAKQGKHEEALTNMQQSVDISRQWGFKAMLIDAYQALAGEYKSSRDFEKSLEAMNHSLTYKDSLIADKSATALAQMHTIYAVDRKDSQIKSLEHDKQVSELKRKRNVIVVFSLVIFTIALIVGGFFYIRHRNLKVNRRTLQLELRSLRAQMNPHFIFNSLSSIHRYIWSNNQEEASDYLTKFSRLMRMILDNTQHTFISLNKELESLQLYLDLESLRCNNAFEYHINVADQLNGEEVLIPPMIIQPYVENAIWHGLVHRPEKGRLDIDIKVENRLMTCKVTDNGIGRKLAMEIKERKGKTHHSMGMKVTMGRIELIRKMNNSKDANVKINDLADNQGNPTGTEVVVVLPVEFIF